MRASDLEDLSDAELQQLSQSISNDFDLMKQKFKDEQNAVKGEIRRRDLIAKLGGLSAEDKKLLGISDQTVAPSSMAAKGEVGGAA